MKKLIFIALCGLSVFIASSVWAFPPCGVCCDIDGVTIGDSDPKEGTFNPSVTITDGTDTHIIKAVQETGGDGQLRIGLAETTGKILTICDYGDIDADFGIAGAVNPTLVIASSDAADEGKTTFNNFTNTGNLTFTPGTWFRVKLMVADVSSGDAMRLLMDSGIELTATTAVEQSVLKIDGAVNQSHANAAYNLIKGDVLAETDTGNGTAGDGNNLLWLGVAGTPKARIDNTGRIVLAESTDPAALANHAFLYAKDVGGTGNLFAADAAADPTQLTSHNFSLFTPDVNEPFPWSFYAESNTIGKKINVDMTGAIRAIEQLTGKKFIHLADIEKVDKQPLFKERWKQKWVKANTTAVEVTKLDAFELVEKDVRTLYDTEVEVIDPKTKKLVKKVVKRGKKIGEKITGYELVGTEVTPKIENLWETHKEQVAQLKRGVTFNESDGKFYKKIVPTEQQAETAAKADFVFELPKWKADRL